MTDPVHATQVTSQHKPLWLLMQDAVINAPPPLHNPAGSIAAAQLRAIADEVVPKQPEPDRRITHPRDYAMWIQRMNTRQRLLNAADEAEGKS